MRARTAAFVAAALATTVMPMPGAGADSHTTYAVQAGAFLNGKGPRQVSMRFFPSSITVHAGDLLRFSSNGTHSATLLPVGHTPNGWRTAFASGDDAPFSLMTADPDEGAERKMNNGAAQPTDPACGVLLPGGDGTERLPSCSFDGTGDGQDGVLSSGIPADGPLDFEVSVDVDVTNGARDFWVIDLVNPTMSLHVFVVGDQTAASSPAELLDEAQGQIATDSAKAAQLHKSYSTKIVKTKNRKTGVSTYTGWAGLDQGAIALRYMYPLKLVLRKKDKVNWKFGQLVHQAHSVTFPKSEALTRGNSLPAVVCDPDGDEGGADDTEPDLTVPPYCDDPNTLELDLSRRVVNKAGDKVYKAGTDIESSGVIGGPFGLATKTHLITFPKASTKKGFSYSSITHPFMTGKVVVK